MNRWRASCVLFLLLGVSPAWGQSFPSSNGYEVVHCLGGVSTDPIRDKAGISAQRDVVGDDSHPALGAFVDDDFLYVRMRLSASPRDANNNLTADGWGFELDSDGDLNDYDILALLDGSSAAPQVQLFLNDINNQIGDPADPAEALLHTYPVETSVQVSVADSSLDGDQDYFLAFALPLADLRDAGLTSVSAVVWAGTTSTGQSLNRDVACQDGSSSLPDLPLMASVPVVVDRVRDTDSDGLPDHQEQRDGVQTDTDGDGSLDTQDTDDDNDGIPTSEERTNDTDLDTDGDQTPNHVDPDDDGDNIATAVERTATQGTDLDGDGILNHLDPDSDGDGKTDLLEGASDSDSDQVPNYLDSNDGDGVTGDADNDGLTNTQEVSLGTNPNVADSDGDGASDGAEVFSSEPGTYQPGSDSNPLDADSDDGGKSDGAEILAGTNPLDASDDGFGEEDPDEDGLTNVEESALGTDPHRRDTDGDGLPDAQELAGGTAEAFDFGVDTLPNDADTDRGGVSDGQELLRGTDPRVADDDGEAQTDLDSDGLSRTQELALGSSPYLWDTDGDGLGDGQEMLRRTNPLSADTDGGGEGDGAEVNAGRRPLTNTDDVPSADADGDGLTNDVEAGLGTRVDARDSDGDGLSDAQEISLQTNPIVADSDQGGISDGEEFRRGTNVWDGSDDGVSSSSSSSSSGGGGPTLPSGVPFIDEDGDGYDDGHAMSGGCVGCHSSEPNRGRLLLVVAVLALWRRRRVVLVVALMFLGSVGTRAEEQTLASQRWQTTLDGKGLARTHSGALLGHLDFDVGLWGDYERNPVVLRNPDRGSLGFFPSGTPLSSLTGWSPSRARVTGLVGQRVASELTLSLGLFNWVELGAALPVVVYQDRGEGISRAPVSAEPLNQFALGDVRLGGKVRILRQKDQFVDLALVPQITLPVGLGFRLFSFDGGPHLDAGASRWAQGFTSEGFPTFQPELALSRELFGFFGGLNAGFRFRRPYQLAKVTVTQELLLRAGVGFKGRSLGRKFWWLPYAPIELGLESSLALSLNHPYLAVPFITPNAKRATFVTPERFSLYNHSGEINATAGLDLLWVHPYVGVGVGVLPGFGTPDFRILSGIRLTTDWASLSMRSAPKPKPAPSDRDKDGILDENDKCPDVAGVAEHGGCAPPPAPVDSDGDGLMDDVDACPASLEDGDGIGDEDGCPEEDADGDGLTDETDRCPLESAAEFDGCPHVVAPDATPLAPLVEGDADADGLSTSQDLCPDEAEDKDGFEDGDGCAEPDNDRDGIPDGTDQCPAEAEAINGNNDDDGCPDSGRTLVVLKRDRIVTVENIHFETGKATITKRSYNQIEQVARYLKANPQFQLRIEGHTDYEGSDEYNMDLSQRRAEAVRAFLIKAGVDPRSVTAVGHGRSRPVSDNTTKAGREKNRRVEFIIQGGTGGEP